MLVYDITNEKSFDNIKNWIRNIEEHASADVEKMILGNKCDMNDRRLVRFFCIQYCTLSILEKGGQENSLKSSRDLYEAFLKWTSKSVKW